ncbi:MAG: hypothetical protein J6W59_04960 [Bacteroidales bacterium]|nr:hypothetical protein [Bacteroidales bacterium]
MNMFGDDFKKSLEPIKTSDELLEKTRRAIEAARYEQAKASVSAVSSSRTSRSPFYLKALVPVACALLLVGGAILIVPKLSHKAAQSDKMKNKSGAIAVHNESIEGVDNVMEAYGEDSEDTYAYSSASLGEHNLNMDMTSIPLTDGAVNYTEFVEVDGHILSYSSNGHKVVWANINDRDKDEVCQLPNFPRLENEDKINGLNYDKNTNILQVSLTIDGTDYVYACVYKDGTWTIKE